MCVKHHIRKFTLFTAGIQEYLDTLRKVYEEGMIEFNIHLIELSMEDIRFLLDPHKLTDTVSNKIKMLIITKWYMHTTINKLNDCI